MAETPKTSFIPKQTMGAPTARAPRRARHFNVFNFVGMVVFLCSLILAVGVFIYKDLSERELAERKQELQERKSSFSISDIESLRELDRRMTVARALLDTHLKPSTIFDMLEQRTLRSLTFDIFSYTRRPSGSVEVVLDGVAPGFNTVALQSRQLQNAAALAHVIFSDLRVVEGGAVRFVATSEVNEEVLSYTAPYTTPAPVAATTTPSVVETATTTPPVVETATTTPPSAATSTPPESPVSEPPIATSTPNTP